MYSRDIYCFPYVSWCSWKSSVEYWRLILLEIEGTAKEYKDENSGGYDDDYDESSLWLYNWLSLADSFERGLRFKYDEEQEAEQTRISS